jgi:hypothetical protein
MTISRMAWVGAAVAAALVITFLVLRRDRGSPEVQVRAAVEEMARAARAHEPAGVLAHVSERFQSPELGGKPELRAYLLGELLRGGVVEARMLDSQVEARPGGEVVFSGRLLLGRTGSELELGQRHLEAVFVEEDGTWRATRARVEAVP